jgi:hypothetical protein
MLILYDLRVPGCLTATPTKISLRPRTPVTRVDVLLFAATTCPTLVGAREEN